MNIDEVFGYYTYRSFLNRPVGSPNDILFGEGELFLLISDEGTVSGTLAFPAAAGAERKDFMDLSGTVTAWDTRALHFIGIGRAGSAIAEFEYEYDCRVAHDWDTATPPQRRSLVGTVRRNKDHGQAKAGATASFIAVQREFVEPRDVPGVGLIPEAVAMLSERTHRLRHTVWHAVRGIWYSTKMTSADRERLRTLGWFLTDPPFLPSGALDLTNGAGEDFLYMHRRMIRMVHEVYDKAGKPRPVSWSALPSASAAQFVYKETTDPADPAVKVYNYDAASSGVMVPPPTAAFLEQVRDPGSGTINPFFRFNKTARGYANLMRNLVTTLRNPRVAIQLTLGTYGNLIEFTVHNWMHMRWATAQPRDPETGGPIVRTDYDIDPKWDVGAYDYLGDFHSSHVHPIFWKLHGWVDDCIGLWEAAHNASHPGQVQREEVRGIPWFAVGPWVLKDDPFDWPGAGNHEHGHGHGGGHGSDEQAVLEKVISILKEVNDRPSPDGAPAAAAGALRGLPGFARFSVLDDERE